MQGQVPVGLISPEASLLGSQTAALLSPQWPCLCALTSLLRLPPLTGHQPVGSGPTLVSSFNHL